MSSLTENQGAMSRIVNMAVIQKVFFMRNVDNGRAGRMHVSGMRVRGKCREGKNATLMNDCRTVCHINVALQRASSPEPLKVDAEFIHTKTHDPLGDAEGPRRLRHVPL